MNLTQLQPIVLDVESHVLNKYRTKSNFYSVLGNRVAFDRGYFQVALFESGSANYNIIETDSIINDLLLFSEEFLLVVHRQRIVKINLLTSESISLFVGEDYEKIYKESDDVIIAMENNRAHRLNFSDFSKINTIVLPIFSAYSHIRNSLLFVISESHYYVINTSNNAYNRYNTHLFSDIKQVTTLTNSLMLVHAKYQNSYAVWNLNVDNGEITKQINGINNLIFVEKFIFVDTSSILTELEEIILTEDLESLSLEIDDF